MYPRFLERAGSPFQPDAPGSQPHLQFLPTVSNRENHIKQPQGTYSSGKDNPQDEASGTDVPTDSRKRKWLRAARGPINWNISPCRGTSQPPTQLEVNSKVECDDGRKHRIAYSITPLPPWEASLKDFHPDFPISDEPPLKVELAWGRAKFRRAVFTATFESWRQRMERGDIQYSDRLIPRPTMSAHKSSPVSSPSRAPPNTRQVVQEELSPLQKESRPEARPALSSLPLEMMSTPSSGIKPYTFSESQVAGSLGKYTSSWIEPKDDQDHTSTIDVSIESEKESHRRVIFKILQNFDSTLSDSSSSSPPYPAPPAISPAPVRRRRPRKEPPSTQSAHRGRTLLPPVVRRRRAGVAAKATPDTSISTSIAKTSPPVNASQQAKREANCGRINHGQTLRGSESLASIFDGDLSDLEEDQAPLSGAVPDSACSRLPEVVSNIRLNTMWRTVAPLRVPRRHQERLAVALNGLKRRACETIHTTNSNTARNAVLARAKKVEQGGISGVMSNSNESVRSHEGTGLNRMLELLIRIRSLPEKGTQAKP